MSTLNIQLLYRRSKRFPLIIHHLLPDLAPGLTSMARTTLISNKFSWSQRGSSQRNSTVVLRAAHAPARSSINQNELNNPKEIKIKTAYDEVRKVVSLVKMA